MNYYETIPHFLAYFATTVLLAAMFIAVYIRVTPHREILLISQGNKAAAIQLVGTFLGFTIPVALVVVHSVNLLDVFLWGIVALVVQLLTFKAISVLFKGIEKKITEDCASSGIFIGGISLGIGILQACCMIP